MIGLATWRTSSVSSGGPTYKRADRAAHILSGISAEMVPEKYVDALIQNIDERFKESSPVLDSLRIFDVLSVPAKTDDGFSYWLLSIIILSVTKS